MSSNSRASYKKKKDSSSSATRPSIQLPEKHRTAYVYTSGTRPTKTDHERIQGVWTKLHVGHVMNDPQEVWIFPKGKEPSGLAGSKHVHGIWGYKPGVDPDNNNEGEVNGEDMWFYTPGEEYPSYFTPRGVWTLPLVKRDISEIAPDTMGFVDVGKGHVHNKMDVAGTWKMMYRRDGLQPEAPIGPGMKSRSTKKASEPFIVHVAHPNGNVLTLTEINPTTDTIMDVKHTIHQKTKLPPKDQNLYFDNIELENTPTLTEYNIESGDTIQLQPTIRFNVKKPDGKIFKLAMKPSDTIADVKDQVNELENIPINEQRLAFKGKELSNTPTLNDVGIQTGDTLDLMGMKVRIQTPDAKMVIIDTSPEETIEQLKHKVMNQTGIPIKEQRYVFDGTELDDNDDTLDECGIKHNDLIIIEPMSIRVRTPDGKVVKISGDINPSTTVNGIKQRVADKVGIPILEQHLKHKGKPIGEDGHHNPTLEQLGIYHDDIIDVSGMEVHIRTPENTLIPIQISKSDTVKDLKKKVKSKTGMPIGEQNLVYKGDVLDDLNDTMDDAGINHGDVIDLTGMTINVKTPDGRFIPIKCRPTSTIHEIKQTVEDAEGVPIDDQRLLYKDKELSNPNATLESCGIQNRDVLNLGGMQIIVETPKGDSIRIDCKPLDTIEDIKDCVYNKTKVDPSDQHLIYKGKELVDDDATLQDYNMKHNDIVDLEEMQVIIRNPEGKKLTLKVKKDNTIQDVKCKIHKKTNLPLVEQHLVFGGNELVDGDTLQECGIQHRDIIDLEPMCVRIRTEDGTFPIDTYPQETIGDIKKKVALKSGVPPENQRLTYQDRDLDNDKDTLDDCGIRHKDIIDLGEPLPTMNIVVNTPYGQKLTLEVDPTDQIKDVKKKIADTEGTPVKNQRLFYHGKQLTDKPTLEQLGIKDGDEIDMGGMQVSVKCPGGRLIMLDATPHDTIASIKQQVENREFVPVGIQRLLFNEKELLSDTSTLQDNGIEHGAIIELRGWLLHVEVPSGDVTTIEVIPSWTIKDVKKEVCKQFKLEQLRHQIKKYGEDKELTLKPSLKYYNIQHNDKLAITEIPTYTVEMSNWQSPFNYQSKPKIKREGVRAKKAPNITNQ